MIFYSILWSIGCMAFLEPLSANEFNNPLNHYTHQPITKFHLYGERCSGTNFTQSLLEKNFPDLESEYQYGSKHFINWLNQEDFEFSDSHSITPAFFKNSEDCLFIFVVRDPYDWLRSFFLSPHHVPYPLKSNGFFYFIRSEWYSEEKVIDNFNPWTGAPFKNVLELRKHRILNILNIGTIVNNFLLVKYEDIRESPEKFITFISNYFDIKRNRSFVPYLTYKNS